MDYGSAGFKYISSQKHVREEVRRLLSSGNICRLAVTHVLLKYIVEPTSSRHINHLITYPPSADINCFHRNPDHL